MRIGPALGMRDLALERLSTEVFDVCVVGGGITGAGVALDAVSRGFSVALVERDDFASGASSRSSKLVHGGLRYLAKGDIGVCRDALRERELLLRLAPGLVQPIRFLYLLPRGGRPPFMVDAGLRAYDLLARRRGADRCRRVELAAAETLAPPLRAERLAGAWSFVEARTDDARLVLTVLEEAVRRGAVVANHVRALDVGTVGARAHALEAYDERSGTGLEIRSRALVNATGVWAFDWSGGAASSARLRPSKGVHLVVPAARLPLACPVVLPVPDGRDVFALPRGRIVTIGTTDSAWDIGARPPRVELSEVEYLLAAVRDTLDVDLKPSDVVAAWAGLRPLIAGRTGATADLSRRHAISISETGVVTVTGGKLTTFRRMALDAVDAACDRLGAHVASRTHSIELGTPDARSRRRAIHETDRIGLPSELGARLLSIHGDRALGILELIADDASLGHPLVPGSETCAAEAVWAAGREMTVTLGDALDRRLGLALYDRDAGLSSRAPELIARSLGWSSEDLEREVAGYRARVLWERGPIAGPAESPAPLSGGRVPLLPSRI